MATVIPSDRLEAHNVNKYNFKVINIAKEQEQKKPSSPANASKTQEKEKITEVDSSALSSSSKESLIESLMQKTDEMSSNFIKLQMKLEQKEEEFEATLAKAKEEAFAQGLEAGLAKAKGELEENKEKSLALFRESVKKLDESAHSFENALEGIKNELVAAAVDIAQEVVKVELSENSNKIAILLADELMKELQSASKVTLKVNPANHGAISEHIGNLDYVSIVSDSAVSEGGVIIISDAGNIDAQISKRFERVKRAALSE